MNTNWYPYLNNKDKKEQSLLFCKKINEGNLIICQQLEYRRYSLFEDYLSFKKFQDHTSYPNQCFYEIITSKMKRKPYFDIDIEKEANPGIEEDIINSFTDIINKEYPSLPIIVYSSHTVKKLSFHIVIDSIYLNDNTECKNFCYNLIDKTTVPLKDFLDKSVYKSIQQFRTIKSHKFEKDNVKVFREDLSRNFSLPSRYLKFQQGIPLYHLQVSLLGKIDYCQYMDGFREEKPQILLREKGFSEAGDLEDVLAIFYNIYSASLFEYLNVLDDNGNLLITFRRLEASYCDKCKRMHENENPFVVVKNISRDIYFYCRRREREATKLGSLGPKIIPDINIDEIKIIEELEETPSNLVEELEHLSNPKKNKKYKGKINLSNLSILN